MALKTCITNYSFARSLRGGQMTVEGFCDFCGRAGFEGVELLSYFWKEKEAEMKALPAWIKRNRLKLAGYGTRSNFLSHRPDEVEQSFENVRVAVEDAKRIGAKICRVFGGSSMQGWTPEAALEQVVAAFRTLTPQAEKAGVTLIVENHGGFPATADEVVAVIEGVGSANFASLFDTGNFLGAAEDSVKAARTLAPYVKHVHVKDMRKLPPGSSQGYKAPRADYHLEGCVLGEGVVPNKEAIAVLKAAGYNGYLSIEAEGPESMDEAQGVIAGLVNLRRWIRELGDREPSD